MRRTTRMGSMCSSFIWYYVATYVMCAKLYVNLWMTEAEEQKQIPSYWGIFAIPTDFLLDWLPLFSKIKLLPNCPSMWRETHQIETMSVELLSTWVVAVICLKEEYWAMKKSFVDEHSPVLQNMLNGFSFFVGWADYAWEQGVALIKNNYYTLSSLFLFWLAESVQWIFEISACDAITADYTIILSKSRVVMSRSWVIISCMTAVHDF